MAEHKPTPADHPKPEDIRQAESALGKWGSFLTKRIPGFNFNAILSLANPQINRHAEATAESLRKTLPEDHWLRGDLVESGIGVIASIIETSSDKQPPLVKALLEKLADWIEAFGRALGGKHPGVAKGGAAHKHEGSASEVAKKVWDKFYADAQSKIEGEADVTKREALKEQLKKDAGFFHELLLISSEGPKKPAEPPKPHVPLTKRLDDGLNKFAAAAQLESKNTTLRAKIQEWKDEHEIEKTLRGASEPTLFGKILRPLLFPGLKK